MTIKNKNTIIRVGIFSAVLISVLLGVYLSFRLAFFLLPFLLAFGLSSIMEPLIKLLSNKLHINRKISVPIVLILLLAILVFVVVLIVLKLIDESKSLIMAAPSFLTNLYLQILDWYNTTPFPSWIPPELIDNLGDVTATLQSLITNLSNTITSLGKTLVKGAFTTAFSFPEILLFTIITVMGTYFMASDRYKIAAVFSRHLPESWLQRITTIKKDMFSAIFGYLRAALIIMSITFIELFIGFSIIRVRYTLLLAFLIAIIDALPVLGTGGVLIPWSIYSFVTGDIRMGISTLVLYLVVLIVRQIIEPKIVGDQIGVYPLVTLVSMYTGLQLIGVAGLILGPITYLLIRNILFAIYKNKTFKEIIHTESTVPAKRDAVKSDTIQNDPDKSDEQIK